jgi:RNA polymerase sigma factor (sigma-70 family)
MQADGLIGERLRNGDEVALAEVYDRFSGLVFGIATRVTGDPSAAEDITQAVFIQVWERPDRFDADRGSFRSWIALLAHRRSVDWVRREVSQRRLSQNAEAEALPSAEEEAVRKQLIERVQAAVQRLPGPQRMVVQLTYYEGCTLVETAAVLGIPEGTAKSRMRSALLRLNGWLVVDGEVTA